MEASLINAIQDKPFAEVRKASMRLSQVSSARERLYHPGNDERRIGLPWAVLSRKMAAGIHRFCTGDGMANRLKGKVAFVTAAGQGIGRAIAEAFVAEGAIVIATDLDAKKLKDFKGAKGYPLDALSTKKVDALAKKVIKEFSAPDILVNCAGYVHQGSVLDCSEKDWDFSFDLNVKSIHRVLRAFLPAMLEHGGGSIVSISSAVSSIRGVPNRYVYGTTKAAIIGLTKAIAADFIRDGIRANAICPGTIQSPSLNQRIEANAKKSGKSLKAVRSDFIERQPIGRLGTAKEVANLAVFLASDESSYITGQAHLVDGGMAL
jgi:2-keto-3-deoxy-L-fuconate dehydrogenase